jgi:hypothetical protein
MRHMERRVAGLLFLLAGVVVLGGGCRVRAAGCAKTYVLARIPDPAPRIDGVLSADEWPPDRWETGLTFPWRDEAAPDTAFCMLTDGTALLIAFRVADADVVIVEGAAGDESLVARGDRVELFLARDPDLDEYYSIEIDPRGRVLDYTAAYYRRFDNAWDCPGLEVAARERPGGYDVEGRIPAVALKQMGLALAPDQPVLAGVFRGEFSHAEGSPDESWISWVQPRVAEPDFHVPSAFGCFRVRAE